MEITYEKVGEINLPSLTTSESKVPTLGMYARQRLTYLKANRKALYTNLLSTGNLNGHLAEIESQARTMEQAILAETMKHEGVDESLKRTDRMRWVQMTNNLLQSAQETVRQELIYS